MARDLVNDDDPLDDADLDEAWGLAINADLPPGSIPYPTTQHSYVSYSRYLALRLDCDLDRIAALIPKARAARATEGDAETTTGGYNTVVVLAVLALPAVEQAQRTGTVDQLRADLHAGDPWQRDPAGSPYHPAWTVPPVGGWRGP
jgi:hypothetical protein